MAGRQKYRETFAALAAREQGILDRVSRGHTLASIAHDLGVHRPTLSTWLAGDEGRAERYALAKKAGAAAIAEEVVAIADASTRETVAADRLRVDARTWLAGRWDPETFGDRPGVAVNVDLGDLFLRAHRGEPHPPVASIAPGGRLGGPADAAAEVPAEAPGRPTGPRGGSA